MVYSVEVFPDGRDSDLRPAQNTKEYAQYCKAAGWKLLDSKKKFCIFQREKEGAVLDPTVAYEDIWPEQETGNADSGLFQSFLGSRLYYYCPENDEELEPAGNGLWYDQYDSRYVWVLERIWEMEKQRFSGEQLDPAKIPGAQLVLASRDGTKWLVRYPDRIVNLESAQMLEESEQQRVWEAFDSGSEH